MAYAVTVEFDKVFNRGTLRGLQVHDSIPHVSVERAKAWIAGIKEQSSRGKVPYTIHNVQIVNNEG